MENNQMNKQTSTTVPSEVTFMVGVTGVLLSDVGYFQVIAPQLDAEVAGARRQVERKETAA